MNSSYCYILQNNAAIFIWNGNSSVSEEQQVAVKMAEFLKVYHFNSSVQRSSSPFLSRSVKLNESKMCAYCLLFSFSHIMQPGTTAKILKEDSEPATFWNLLGGKKTHPNYRESKEAGKDPHLFSCSLLKGMFVINMSNISHFPSYKI